MKTATMLDFLLHHENDDLPASAAATTPREPVDETLLRAPEFSTDEFRIYKFKVRERERGERGAIKAMPLEKEHASERTESDHREKKNGWSKTHRSGLSQGG